MGEMRVSQSKGIAQLVAPFLYSLLNLGKALRLGIYSIRPKLGFTTGPLATPSVSDVMLNLLMQVDIKMLLYELPWSTLKKRKYHIP